MDVQAWRGALYLRLSRDDENIGESESIANQRTLLRDYAAQQGFAVVSEYVDDGWPGTNYDRPGFRRMLGDIDRGDVNLVLVKDLSRLGRDYIQTGRYLELVFPEKGVRCIAVNDGIDTARADADMAPFRNVVNELYARDISRKIRSVLRAKMRDGQFVGNFAPYGYRKDPDDKHHLLPDEPAAGVVRKLFAWAAAGKRPAEIARVLNGRGVLPPALYRCERNPTLDPDKYSSRKAWTSAGVARILKNVVYLGDIAQGKTDKVSFKVHKSRHKSPDEWVVVQGCHEPLVPRPLFEAVQRQAKSRRCPGEGTFCNLFSGLAFCADCGKAMSAVGTRKKGSVANLACGAYKAAGNQACTNHFIAYEALYQCVLDALRACASPTQAECGLLFGRLCEKLRPEPRAQRAGRQREALQKELRRLGGMVGQLYDDRMQGRLGETNFYPLLARYEQRTAEIQRQLAALDAESPQTGWEARQARDARLRQVIARYAALPALTPAVLFELVERIEVGQGEYWQAAHGREKRQRVCIRFRFQPAPYETEIIT
ncbi:recombinase family protein [Intestinibacillus massiliensis]|nr:recombinase family protein [Intestinibacillus massiliensis]